MHYLILIETYLSYAFFFQVRFFHKFLQLFVASTCIYCLKEHCIICNIVILFLHQFLCCLYISWKAHITIWIPAGNFTWIHTVHMEGVNMAFFCKGNPCFYGWSTKRENFITPAAAAHIQSLHFSFGLLRFFHMICSIYNIFIAVTESNGN